MKSIMEISKKNIAAFFKQLDSSVHFAGILREFGGRHVKRELKRVLDDMVACGELIKLKGNSYTKASDTKGDIRGKLLMHRDGYGFVIPEQGGEDIFIPQRRMKNAMSGDIVEVRTARSRMGGDKVEGTIVKIAERAMSRIVGRYEESSHGSIVIPEDTRLNTVIFIPRKGQTMPKDGQQVVVELTAYPAGGRPPEGRIMEVLGWPDDPDVEALSVIRRFELPDVFGDDTQAEAATIPESVLSKELNGRIDLRSLPMVTIDGETARDFDDAVSLKKEGSCFRLFVSIADVSHYVTPGSALDRDAFERGTSVYFPGFCIPMLPERLSNGICSLNPKVDRLTMTAEMLFNENGAILESSFYPSVIRSSARLTYTLVKKIIVDSDEESVASCQPLVPMLMEMKELAEILTAMRKNRGSLDFDLPEAEIIIGATGETENIVRVERNLAHRLIEEFMLAANEAVAAFITNMDIPFLYRIHENPDPAKLATFRELVFGLGYEILFKDGKVEPTHLRSFLDNIAGRPEERMANYALLRCMKQARYSPENIRHFGLASSCYCHFTSPIRRYPDLVVHRILRATLALEKDKTSKRVKQQLPALTRNLGKIAEHTSKRERIAMEAERDIITLKKIKFMTKHLGEEFNGFINGITGFGFFVELDNLFVEGLVHISSLDDDNYVFIESRHSLIGRNRKQSFRIGDQVKIRVISVSPDTRKIEFALIEHTPAIQTENTLDAHEEEFQPVPIRGKHLTKPKRSNSVSAKRSDSTKKSRGKSGVLKKSGAPRRGKKTR